MSTPALRGEIDLDGAISVIRLFYANTKSLAGIVNRIEELVQQLQPVITELRLANTNQKTRSQMNDLHVEFNRLLEIINGMRNQTITANQMLPTSRRMK